MLLVCMFHMLLSLSLCCCVGGTGESVHWSLVSLELRFLVMMSDNVGVRLAQDSEQCCILYIGFTIGFPRRHYDNLPVPYDFCVGNPVSCLLTMRSTPVQHSVLIVS